MEILVRKKMLHGDPQMLRAQILSTDGDQIRVVLEGHKTPTVVTASETMPIAAVYGAARPGQRASQIIPKSYPTSFSALGNLLRK